MHSLITQHISAKALSNRVDGKPLIIGITGQDASGKTHLGRELVDQLKESGIDSVLIQVDDFHRTRAERYDPTMSEPQAYLNRSFDFEKLVSKILDPLSRNAHIDTTLWHLDLATDSHIKERRYVIQPTSVVVVEGVLLLRPDVRKYLDFTVYVHADRESILDRAYIRDVPEQGDDVMRKYDTKYMPAQREHLDMNPPRLHSNMIVDNSRWQDARPLPLYSSIDELFAAKRPRILLFDFWETLVPLPATTKRRAFFETAATLDEDPRLLRPMWTATRHHRETQDFDLYLQWLASTLGRNWSLDTRESAARARRRIHGEMIQRAASDVIPKLDRLRAAGARLGLVSNCTSDLREMLEETKLLSRFDSLALSAETGFMKPDTRIYAASIRALPKENTPVVYIGDGSDAELDGAFDAGLEVVRLNTEDNSTWPWTTATTLEFIVDSYERNNAA